ncbi:MAG: ornithine cyclodeaminase family protein, partial [Candidatus Heimdallarchaeota archaeon]
MPNYSGLMLLFNQKTGELISVMLDEGHLTNIRTAAAGAVVAKYLAPKKVNCIGIYGTGVQARLQLEYLKSIIDCKDVIAWGRNEEKLEVYAKEMTSQGYNVKTTTDSNEVTSACNYQITKGTHITAMGSDTPVKQELDAKILQKADRVVADSIEQVLTRGECYHAVKSNLITKEKLTELGLVIQDKN